jgi:predicted nucleotidyltransferase component of viral defense system
MPFGEVYRAQVSLLIRALPHVTAEDCFALKGGTAINLFVRDMPRLSVDIDLTYLPVEPRGPSLGTIDRAMNRIADRLRRAVPRSTLTVGGSENVVTRLFMRADGAQIKIEVTPVLRGCVYEPELRGVRPVVEDAFGFAEIKVVSFADLYAGKIVAALDRQHPRDLFDVRDLLANEGIDMPLRRAFLVYLISHDRPMAEVLNPTRKEISAEFLRGFQGMTDQPVAIETLTAAREALIDAIIASMPAEHRRFLLSFKAGNPEWDLLGVLGASALPAVRWRQQNLDKVSAEKRAALVAQLETALRIGLPPAT